MFVTILVVKWDQWTNLVPTHVNWSATNTLHHWVTANTPFHIWQAKISKLQESKRKKNQIKSRSYIKQCWYLTEKMSRLATLAATHLGSAQQSPTTVSKHKTHASHRIFCDQLVTKLHLTKHTKDASPTNINFIKLKRIYVTRYMATFLNPTLILNSSFPTGWLRRIFSSFKSLWTISEIYFIKTSCKYNWFDVNDRPTILPFVYLSSPEFSLTTFQESWRNISTHPKLYIVSISSSQFFFLFHFRQCPISLLFPH